MIKDLCWIDMQAACSMEHVQLVWMQDDDLAYMAVPFWSSSEDCMLHVRLHFESSQIFIVCEEGKDERPRADGPKDGVASPIEADVLRK